MNKRGEGIAIEKLITVIIVLIVIIVIIVALFKFNLTDYLRNLPDYMYNNEDKNITVGGDDKPITSNLCPSQVGKVEHKQYNKVLTLWGAFAPSSAVIYIDDKKTSLIWGISKNKIELDEWANEDVGYVDENFKISIYTRWLNDDTLRNSHKTIPSVEELKKIDGSYIRTGNRICK